MGETTTHNKAYKLRRFAPWPTAHCGKKPPQRLICLNVMGNNML